MNYSAWFQCAESCEGKYQLNEIIYRCPKCDGLLEVKHDLAQLKTRSPQEWMDLFDRRYMRTAYPYGSGVWGKKELVCPNIENENIVSMYEGGTNLFWAERFGKKIGVPDLWLKQCGISHSGSFKDLGMTVLVSMVKQMLSEGKKIRAVICASSGDTSASLAAYAAAAGIPAIILLPKAKVSATQLIQPLSNGAITFSLDTDFDGCMKIVQQLAKEPDLYLANSINSLRIEGQKTISFELAQQFDWTVPDSIIIPGGNLGNVTALGSGFMLMRELGIIDRLPRLICAQAENANPLYKSYLTGFEETFRVEAKTTLASAIQIGNPVSIGRAIKTLKKFDGIVAQASEDELANAAAWADRTGLFNCPHTGVALAVLRKLLKEGKIDRSERVVVVSTATGLKFSEFKVDYHYDRHSEVKAQHINLPIEIAADYSGVMSKISSRIE